MPTYEYQCPEGHAFEKIQKMADKPRAKCPTCGKPAVRKISGGSGLVFRGTGFYITDYGKDGKGPRKPESEKSEKTEKSEKPTEAKEAKAETKPSAKSAKPDPKPSKKAAGE